MKKALLLVAAFSVAYIFSLKSALAAGCDIFDYYPSPLLVNSPEADFTLGLTEPGKIYTVEFNCKEGLLPQNVRIEHIVANENTITTFVQKSQHSCVFGLGKHNVSLWEEGRESPACTSQYEVVSGCRLEINDTSPDTNTNIIISGVNASSRLNLLCISGPLNPFYEISVKSDNTFSQTFKIASKGDYIAKVIEGPRCNQPLSSYGCQGLPFSVRMPGAPTPGGGGTWPGGTGGGIKPTPCPVGTDAEGGILTALGCIPTKDPTRFVAWILKFAIGIGGGIAILLIIFGAFQVMTSSGNPENLKKGNEMITSAIGGLIFIIFSVFLLKLIGVNILSIPGLSTP